MKAFILSFLFLTVVTACFAQRNCSIKKAYAWYNVSMPGTQMSDENGNPIPPKKNIIRFIYVEYSAAKIPDIKSVLYNFTELSFSVVNVTAKTVSIGDKKMNPNCSITAKKGNKLLKIDLQPAEGKIMPDTDSKSIVIKSKVAGKLCAYYIMGEKEFFSPPNY